MKLIPIYDATEPIACTIDDAEVADRVALVERMRTNVERVERTEHGVLLHFLRNDDVEADVRRFALDEKRCCRFWGFEVTTIEDRLQLRWDGPPATDEVLDQLHAFFRGDAGLAAIAGLL